MAFFRPRRPYPIERHVLAARSAAADAYALAHEHAIVADDLDRDVVLQSLHSAMGCLSALVWALHVEFDDLDPHDREFAIGELVRKAPSQWSRRPKDPHGDLVHLVERAIDKIEAIRADAMRSKDRRVRTFAELDACVWHLATVLHIVDLASFERLLKERAIVRAQLALAEPLMKTAIAEHRIAARERREA